MFNAWPDIEALYNVRRRLAVFQERGRPLTAEKYRAKVKLDGTNAAVRIEKQEGINVFYQSRTRDVTPTDDNMGFAKWAAEYSHVFVEAAKKVDGSIITFYGEWCGMGIQSGTAVSKAPRRFAIFAIQIDDNVLVEPSKIEQLLGDTTDTIITVLPWYGNEVDVDYTNFELVESAAAELEKDVLAVEACDPWVKSNFNIEGVGEGIVLYPIPDAVGFVARGRLSLLMFKAKGQKHRVKAAKVAVQVNPDVINSIDEFAKTFTTEARCKQGLTVACGGIADMKTLGNFMKWIMGDIEKEAKDDLEASGLQFKQVVPAAQKIAREWFFTEIKRCS